MSKVQCIFGKMQFCADGVLVLYIDKEEYIEETIAEEYCDAKIDSNEYDSYVIPNLFYPDIRGIRGKVDYSRCKNKF
mgnify:FL=1